MRKFWGLIMFVCLLFSGNCFAMQFSQPEEIGKINIWHPPLWHSLSPKDPQGITFNKATEVFISPSWECLARFGNDEAESERRRMGIARDFRRFYTGFPSAFFR